MLNSKSKSLGKLVVPKYSKNKELIMLPINLAGDNRLPKEFEEYKQTVDEMIAMSPVKEGTAYLTIHAKKVKAKATHRRGGPHTDGNFFPPTIHTEAISGWATNHGGGWKIGENGPPVGSKEHKLSYCANTGGMLIASNYSLCRGWNGKIKGIPGVGGDCSKIKNLGKGFMLKANKLYLTTSQFVHESTPTLKDVERVLIRITLPSTASVKI